MKVFVTLLLLANLIGWGWVVWQQPTLSSASLIIPQSADFGAAKKELELLDIASARRHPVPVVAREVDEDEEAVGKIVSVEQIGNAPGIGLEPASAPQSWCGLSDTFQTREEAASWLSEWLSAGATGSVVETEVPVSSTWWVHLPPFSSEPEARIILDELQGKKIDSFYMRTGELAGGISLGVFSRKESALLVQADLGKKGYAASVKEILRLAKRFQATLELQKSVQEVPQMQVLQRRQGPEEVHETPCR